MAVTWLTGALALTSGLGVRPSPFQTAARVSSIRLALPAQPALREFFLEKAGVDVAYVDRVLSKCDEEYIGDVAGLRVAMEAGLLNEFFKPVVRLGIESALERLIPDVSIAAAQVVAIMPNGRASSAAQVTPKAALEVEPYHAILPNLPLNTFKNKAPHIGSIVNVKRIVGASSPGEVCHIQISTGGALRYWEGQSVGVVPPGTNPKNGKPNSVRLYSIASTRYGDDLAGDSVSLCVRRALYWDAELKGYDPAKKGVCSNFLCDSKPGDPISVTGPTGKVMLMPEATPKADLIMIATGTGIAPYRGFLRRLFVESTPAADAFTGLAWLFLGVANADSLLYDDDWQEVAARDPERFRATYALSREMSKPDGSKVYVQDKVAEHADEVFARMDAGAHMYFCGLKGMMPGITEMLQRVSEDKGLVWEDKLTEWKANGQWHVEVY